jgi:alpha 1,2-mannosyltransferase
MLLSVREVFKTGAVGLDWLSLHPINLSNLARDAALPFMTNSAVVARNRPRLIKALAAILFLMFFTSWVYLRRQSLSTYVLGKTRPQTYPMVPYEVASHIEFWSQFQPLLVGYRPACDPPQLSAYVAPMNYKPTDPGPRPSFVVMEEEDVIIMKNAHEGLMRAITELQIKPHYHPGTRGIISTAGGSYLPVFVIDLRMLRRIGSKLPVEVFIANAEEYEEYVCDVVLPSLNARCVLLSDVLDSLPQATEIRKYQFKSLAMLFSSFEEIMFIDADVFPLQNPDLLFATEPFTSSGMLTWPDFWYATASPLYYTISGQEIPPMNLRQSTESGELMMSKKSHANTLLLATYYNFWGPSHYYHLLAQGAPGEGDKETFIAAAVSAGDTFYQVSEPVETIGRDAILGFLPTAMVQFDPGEDYSLTQNGMWRINGSIAPRPRPFFIHANAPKYDPATIFDGYPLNPILGDEQTYTHAWTKPEATIEEFGPDLERHFWQEIKWTACVLEGKLRCWEGKVDICRNVTRYWNAIYGTNNHTTITATG